MAMHALALLSALALSAQAKMVCKPMGLDIIFVNDGSGSVFPHYPTTLQFINGIVNKSTIDEGTTQIGMYQFSDVVRLEFHLNSFRTKAEVMAAVAKSDHIQATTNIVDAMRMATEDGFAMAKYGNNPAAKDVMILITDGADSRGKDVALPLLRDQAKNAADRNITVFVIGVGHSIDQEQLEAAAGHPSRVYNIDGFDGLAGLQQTICETIEEAPPVPVTTPATPSPRPTTPQTTRATPPPPPVQRDPPAPSSNGGGECLVSGDHYRMGGSLQQCRMACEAAAPPASWPAGQGWPAPAQNNGGGMRVQMPGINLQIGGGGGKKMSKNL